MKGNFNKILKSGKDGARRAGRKLWILPAALLVVAAVVVVVVLAGRKPEPENIPVVQTQTVQTQDVEVYGEYPGTIRAQQFVEVRARVEGYLESMLFEEGSYVERNQRLFIIDPRQYQATVDKDKAQLEKNKALAQQAERALRRIEPLYEQQAASQLDLDNAVANYETAKAEVQMSEADLAQSELALGYTVVRSPGGQSLLATIVKSDTVFVEFKMTDLDYQKSKARNVNFGQTDTSRTWAPYVKITLADKSVYPYSGLVDFADPQVDTKSGTFSVRAKMPNPEHALLPGQFTNVTVLLDVRENTVVVPTKAISTEKTGSYIFVLRPNGTVEKRFIEIGPENGNNTIVERGLLAGEEIVVEGYHKLIHGMKARKA